MNVTNFFGEYLAKLTGKIPIACRGMIRLAVNDAYPNKTPELLDYLSLKDVFNTTLKQRLNNIKIPNYAQIIQKMVDYLLENQSLLTMI